MTDHLGRILLSAFLLSVFAAPSFAAERIALVVGNDTYLHAPELRNAVADSKLVAEVLKEVGFTVISLENAGVDSFYEALEEMKRRSGLARVGLIYFAGHGIEVEGENYLLPVDAELVSPGQLRSQTIALGTVLRDMADARLPAKLLILDCCRDNPIGRNWITSRSLGKGLAPVRDAELPEAALVMYSAGPGQVALDGSGDNSPFTAALAKRLREPGQNVFDAFLQTSDDVVKSTGRRQEPWLKFDGAGRSFRELVFLPAATAPTVAAVTPAPVPSPVEVAKVEVAKVEVAKVETAPALGNSDGKAELAPAATGGATTEIGGSAAKPEPTATLPTEEEKTLAASVENLQAGGAAAAFAAVAPPSASAEVPETVTAADLPPAKEEAIAAVGSATMAVSPQSSSPEADPIDFPSRGYFNNAEVLQGGPYESYNAASQSSILRSVQEALATAGRADGQMGRNTQSAIVSYQHSNAIAVTGTLDADTLESLGLLGIDETSPVASAPKPSTTPTVRKSSSSTPTRSSSSPPPPRSSPPPPQPQPSNKLWKPAGDSPGTMSHSKKKFMRPG